jgi:hypothetical protein
VEGCWAGITQNHRPRKDMEGQGGGKSRPKRWFCSQLHMSCRGGNRGRRGHSAHIPVPGSDADLNSMPPHQSCHRVHGTGCVPHPTPGPPTALVTHKVLIGLCLVKGGTSKVCMAAQKHPWLTAS